MNQDIETVTAQPVHPTTSRPPSNRRRPEPTKKVCRFFNTPAGCNRGDQCPFLHVLSVGNTEVAAGEGASGPDPGSSVGSWFYTSLHVDSDSSLYGLTSLFSTALP